jgi:hypothetical protein
MGKGMDSWGEQGGCISNASFIRKLSEEFHIRTQGRNWGDAMVKQKAQ